MDITCGKCELGVWIYEETNGIEDLQRHDPASDDTCAGDIDPERLLFGAFGPSR